MADLKAVRVADIIFDRTDSFVVSASAGHEVIACDPTVTALLRQYSARELATEILGAIAEVDPARNHVVRFITTPREMAGTAPEGGEAFAAPQDEPAPKQDQRVKVDRYGVAVAIYNGVLHAHPVDHRGAISPTSYGVTKPSPEFLADVNAALGTSLTLSDFPESVVRGR